MKRKELNTLLSPLSEKLYRFAYTLIPDDLQAEQLVIDSFNAFLLRERKKLIAREIDLTSKNGSQILRRQYFKGILQHMLEIGVRRSIQLNEQLKITRPQEYGPYYSLDPKVRFVMSLRYDAQFSVEEIEEIVQVPRYEVIEKIHNGRFLLLSDLNRGVNV
jgi:hypothetical protein